MKVYVIRHGETVNNRENRWSGCYDTSLTEKGYEDARAVGARLQGIPFDKVYASTLSRAVGTARTALPDYVPEQNALLRELDVGNIENKPSNIITPEERQRTRTEGYTAYGGESREEFWARVREFMELLEQREDQRVAVFTHLGWLLAMLKEVLGVTIPAGRLSCGNCVTAVFEYTKETGWKLHSWLAPDQAPAKPKDVL